jgi:hypothetical protein
MQPMHMSYVAYAEPSLSIADNGTYVGCAGLLAGLHCALSDPATTGTDCLIGTVCQSQSPTSCSREDLL